MSGTYTIRYSNSTPAIPHEITIAPMETHPKIGEQFPLKFAGYRYPQYGETIWTNFLHLLEKFANTTAPPNPVVGQLWFDTSTPPGTYCVFDMDGNWQVIGGAPVSSIIAPVASFTKSVTTGTAPLSVIFTDTSTNGPTSWLWTFGDGTTSAARNPSKSYASAGSYSVTLTVTNTAGSSTTAPQSVIVSAVSLAPVASFTKSATSGPTPLSIVFTDTSTNSPTSWSWNFGDGTTSTTRNPTKLYASAGSYGVTLKVTNSVGSSTTAAQVVTATAATTYNEVVTWNTTPPTAGSQTTSAIITGGSPNTAFTVSWTGTPLAGVPASGGGTLNSSGSWSLAAGNHFPIAGTYTGTYVFAGSGNTKTVAFTTSTYNEIVTAPTTKVAGGTSFSLSVVGGAPSSVVTGTSTKGNWTTTAPWVWTTSLPAILDVNGTKTWTVPGFALEEAGYYKGVMSFDTGHTRAVNMCVTPPTISDVNGIWATGSIIAMSNGTFVQGTQLVSSTNATVNTINGWYVTYVNRKADQGGMIYWLEQVAASSLDAVLPTFIANVELSKTTPGGLLYGRTVTGAVDFCTHVQSGKASYVLTSPSYTVAEGNTVQVWVSTTNVPLGTALTWKVWGGDTGSSDITPLSGSLTVGVDYGEFINFTVNKDTVSEANKYFAVELYKAGVIIATSPSFTITANAT